MASPDGLRLFLGNRLPGEVLDCIFSFGFHLWLATPNNAFYQVYYHNGKDGRDGYHMYRLWTTVRLVWDILSPYTQNLVNYEEYLNSIVRNRKLSVRYEARPVVCNLRDDWDYDFHWTIGPDGKWALAQHMHEFPQEPCMYLDFENRKWLTWSEAPQESHVRFTSAEVLLDIGYCGWFLDWEIPSLSG